MRFLAGYEEHFADGEVIPLVNGERFLAWEGFWAAYYFGQGLCVEEDGDVVFPSFEVFEETVREVYDELTNSERWPVMSKRLVRRSSRLSGWWAVIGTAVGWRGTSAGRPSRAADAAAL